MGGIGTIWNSELLKAFCYDIQDDHHGSHLVNLLSWPVSVVRPSVRRFHFFDISSRIISWIELKLCGRQWCSWRFRIRCVPISKMTATAAVLKIFKPHLLPNAKADWAKTWSGAFKQHGDSVLLKSFHSNVQDYGNGGHLETAQIKSPPEPLSWIELPTDGKHWVIMKI